MGFHIAAFAQDGETAKWCADFARQSGATHHDDARRDAGVGGGG